MHRLQLAQLTMPGVDLPHGPIAFIPADQIPALNVGLEVFKHTHAPPTTIVDGIMTTQSCNEPLLSRLVTRWFGRN